MQPPLAAGLALADIVARLGGTLRGDAARQVRQVATLSVAGATDIAFLANPKYRSQLATTRAAAVILDAASADACPVDCLITPDPYGYYARVAQWLNPPEVVAAGIRHFSATVHSALPASVLVAAGARIGREVVLGENVAHRLWLRHRRRGAARAGTVLHGSVTVYARCIIGRVA